MTGKSIKSFSKISALSASVLFSVRLFFYLSVAALILFHPGIVVSYDRVGLVQWFFIIPIAALIAFLPAPKGKLTVKLIIALLFTGIVSIWASSFSPAALVPFIAGLVAFILTLLLFHYPRWGKLSLLEPFFFAWVCLRLLSFSRAGEDVAGESIGLTQIILVWTAMVFLFHSALVYFCLNSGSLGGAKSEGAVFAIAAVAALALIIFFLPADFIRNTVIDNLLPDPRDRLSKPSDHDWGIPDDAGGGRRRGRSTIPGDSSGQGPSLRGVSEHDWPGEGSRMGRSRNGAGGANEQYTVMVVASKFDPLYMGNIIRGRLDPINGFLTFQDEILNRLPTQRFFVSWFDNEPVHDMGRVNRDIFSLSVLPQKYLPYRPFEIEPTIQSENTGPFRYIHRIVSNVHLDDPLNLLDIPVRDLSPLEKAGLAPYMDLPLNEADRELFSAHLDHVLGLWEERRGMFMGGRRNEYMEKILAILMGFSEYQYNVNMHIDCSVADMLNFLLNTKDGDCVEFSNSAALLARLAGVPSRIVTGYLAADNLQTIAHLRGLAALRSRIPVLQEFPFNDLYLVTDAHGHSWPQFYVPDYGWLDFEATAFAIPPLGLGDGNLRDVVIPLMGESQVFSQVRAFPWRAILRVMVFLAVLTILCAYALRYGRELTLRIGAGRGGAWGARSLYLLLLARLAADGKPIKPASKTAMEYAQLFGGMEGGSFAGFSRLYSELRWKDFPDKAEMDERFSLLWGEYRKILAENRRKGVAAFLIRIFSLRALAYL